MKNQKKTVHDVEIELVRSGHGELVAANHRLRIRLWVVLPLSTLILTLVRYSSTDECVTTCSIGRSSNLGSMGGCTPPCKLLDRDGGSGD